MRQATSNPALRWAWGIALLLVSNAALALGLGEIRVKSQPGQPLVAEIPIISNDPAEMEQLQARLAAPATFERVGLARPSGLVSGLNFMVAVSDEGKPVIRVTSAEPVQQDVVSFLIEVDWGQGRLVREYAALVSSPGTVAAVSEPLIDAPAATPADTIVREPTALPPATPAQELPPPVARPEPSPPPAAPSRPVPTVAAAPAPTRAQVQPGEALARVRGGQTLSGIASGLRTGQSLNQTMLALLRANPDAFINGNINLLKQGAVLRMPSSDELNELSRAQASALVSQQVAEWRQARRPAMQPVAASGTGADAAPAVASASTAAAADPARLEIAPALADAAQRTGTTSGLQAGGEGNMLADQQLQQSKEDLAARDSEIQELRTQVAELEKIKTQQEKLIALKDSDLATAQQRLAQTQEGGMSAAFWWIGLLLLAAGLFVGWWFARGRSDKAAPARSRFDVASLAASLPPTAATATAEAEAEEKVPAQAAPVEETSAETAVKSAAAEEVNLPPQWTFAPSDKPTWHMIDSSLNVSSLNAAPAGRERLELAIAYLDLGDRQTARSLLNEVVAGTDAEARERAARLLLDLDRSR